MIETQEHHEASENPTQKIEGVKSGTHQNAVEILQKTHQKLLYHGTANVFKGGFDLKKSNTSSTIFLTESKNFADSFGVAEEARPNGVTYEANVDLGNTFDSNSQGAIEQLRPLIGELVKENYHYPATDLNYKTDRDVIFTAGEKIENPTHEDWVNHYMWRAKGNWRLMESPRVIEYLQNQGYDSFSMQEMGATTYGVFDINRVNFLSYTDKSGKTVSVN